VAIAGVDYRLSPEDVLIGTEQAADWVSADSQGVQIAMSTVLTPALLREGMARDFVRQVQQLRKDADLEIEDRIKVGYTTSEVDVRLAVDEWNDYICQETLTDGLTCAEQPAASFREALVGDHKIGLWVERSS
jgi:isoleucyl-tRNA synthetase